MVAKSKNQSFAHRGMYQRKEPHPFTYLSQKATFWVAVMSLFAFVTGNMLGQHGWHVFWASVLGNVDESSIVCDGFGYPLPGVPDYARWSKLGGNVREHTYRQLPRDYLLPFPKYDPSSPDTMAFLIDHLATYKTGRGQGSHPGMDLVALVGTPVLSIGNGIVVRVDYDAGGYGNYIVIKHPNVPDPDNASKRTNLYSVYAHLESSMVAVSDVVRKGSQIGTAGMTGFTTGAHLHFQIDREEAPWHPYWPFSGTEARQAGLTMTQAVDSGFHRDRGLQLTTHPFLYIQANTNANSAVVKAKSASSAPVIAKKTPKQMREERLAQRKAKYAAMPAPAPATVAVSSAQPVTVAETQIVAIASPGTVASILIRHDGTFSADRGREKVSLTLLDADGHVVEQPVLDRRIELRTAFGRAEFYPSSLAAADFVGGKAEVEMLPLGQQTVVVVAQPWGIQSAPMKYTK